MTDALRSSAGAPGAADELRVLLVEDSPGDAVLIQRSLDFASGRRWTVERVPTLAAGLAAIAEDRHDCVLVDYRLPDGSAQELIAEMKRLGDRAPVIVITGVQDETVARTVLGSGAEDHVSKDDLDGQVLVRAVNHACARHRLRSELMRANRVLEDLLRERTREVMEVADVERQRLAEALHDESGQWMTALAAQLGALERTCSEVPLRGRISECRELCEGAMSEISRICRHLHPSVIETGGLLGALHSWQTSAAEPRVLVELGEVDERRLSTDAQLALYRCAQEAITNARKHARASTVRVSLDQYGGATHLRVQDDGVGMSAPCRDAISAGVGLVGMRHRIEQLAGTFEITSAQPGTCVHVSIPTPGA